MRSTCCQICRLICCYKVRLSYQVVLEVVLVCLRLFLRSIGALASGLVIGPE